MVATRSKSTSIAACLDMPSITQQVELTQRLLDDPWFDKAYRQSRDERALENYLVDFVGGTKIYRSLSWAMDVIFDGYSEGKPFDEMKQLVTSKLEEKTAET